MKINYKILLTTLATVYTTFTQAQIGKQIGILYAAPFASADDIAFTGNSGWGLRYGFFAKYSDRMEWNSYFYFSNSSLNNKEMQYNGNNNFSEYIVSETERSNPLYLVGAAYQLTYFVLPDQLGVSAGFILGANFGGAGLSEYDGDAFLSKEPEMFNGKKFRSFDDIKNTGSPDKNLFNPKYEYAFFNYGLKLGLSYTLAEKFVLSADYTFFLNRLYDTSEGTQLDDFMGSPRVRLFELGFTYKLMPSIAKRRF